MTAALTVEQLIANLRHQFQCIVLDAIWAARIVSRLHDWQFFQWFRCSANIYVS